MATSPYPTPTVVATLGYNHMGDFDIAKTLIAQAKTAGAAYVQFQKRNNKIFFSPPQYHAPYFSVNQSAIKHVGEYYDLLEFTIQQHAQLKEFAEASGIGYSVTAWDVISASEIVELLPHYIQVPDAVNTNFELLQILRDEYEGDVHISLGMTTHEEEEAIVVFFEQKKQAKNRLVLYSATAAFPIAAADVCLLEIARLKKKYHARVKEIGFKGHHLGIDIDIAAYTLGATWIERFFTTQKTLVGEAHLASLELPEFQKLVYNLNNVHAALVFKEFEILDVEVKQWNELKYKKG